MIYCDALGDREWIARRPFGAKLSPAPTMVDADAKGDAFGPERNAWDSTSRMESEGTRGRRCLCSAM